MGRIAGRHGAAQSTAAGGRHSVAGRLPCEWHQGGRMRFRGTRKFMSYLRERNSLVGGLKIDEWVDAWVDERIARGEPLTVLTQWCISRNLEARFRDMHHWV